MSSRVVVAGKSSLADALTPNELTQPVHELLSTALQVNKEHVEHYLECAICRGVMREPVMIKQCLHRFCKDCLEQSLRTLKNECPLCRTRIPSRRSLERDERFAKLIELVYTDVDGYEAQQNSKLEQVAHASRANAVAIRDAAQHSGGKRRGQHAIADARLQAETRRMQADAAAVAAASSSEPPRSPAPQAAPAKSDDTAGASAATAPSQQQNTAAGLSSKSLKDTSSGGEQPPPSGKQETPSRGKRARSDGNTDSTPTAQDSKVQPSASKKPRAEEAPSRQQDQEQAAGGQAASSGDGASTAATSQEMVTFKVGRTPEPSTLGPFFSSAIGGTHYKFLQLPASATLEHVAQQLGTWYPQYDHELKVLAKHGWKPGLALLLRGRADTKTPDIPGDLLPSTQYPERCYRLLHPLGPGHKVLTLGDIAAHARKLSVKDGQQKAGGGMFASGQGGKTTSAVPVLRLLWHYCRTTVQSGVVEVAAARACRHNLLLHGKHSSDVCGCGVEEPAFAKPPAQAGQA